MPGDSRDDDLELGGEAPCFAAELDGEGRMPEAWIEVRRVYGSGPGSRAGRGGHRVLVDRVWPRGIRKDALGADLWAREVAPSAELRGWFGHRSERWEEFERRYREELREPERAERLRELEAMARAGPLTLLFGAADEQRNQAVVLRRVLVERLATRRSGR
ncbi:MAG: DUF488 domain-containing protein [Candidatus Dormibacteraceae bacterium]